MKSLKEQVFDDVVRICEPLQVEVVHQLLYGAPYQVTIQVQGELESCEVVLYSGASSVENDELAADLDGRLIRLLSNSPYRLISQTRGVAFGNAYQVGWTEDDGS